ncbi:MAG: M16 family metallopeptidase [Sciscionella sp.]
MTPNRPQVAPAEAWSFPLPDFYRLPNDLAVWQYQLPGQRLASAKLIFDLPLSAEDRAVEGITYLMARTLDEGTRVRSAEEFAEETELLGACYSARVSYSGFRTGVEVPVGRIAPALELLAEAASLPAFPSDEVSRAVRNRCDDIVDELARPGRRAKLEIAAAMFAATCRLSRPDSGSAQTVAGIGRDELSRWYDTQVDPGRATLVLAGDFAGLDMPATVAGAFAGWRGGTVPADSPIEPVSRQGRRVRVVHRPGAVQTHLEFGVPATDRTDARWAGMRVASHALGGTITSRLDVVLREEKGYTYGIRAGLRPYRRGSAFAITGSVHTAVTGDAVALALELVAGVRTGGITENERSRAVDYLLGVTPLRYQTATAVAERAADLVHGGLGPGHVAVQRAALATVTDEGAGSALAPCLDPERLSLVAVGDADVIADQLRACYGDVEVVDA